MSRQNKKTAARMVALETEVERLRAQLLAGATPEGQQDWKPIETAPKTSKNILVWTPENKCTSLVVWADTRTPQRWEHAFGGSRLIDEPTHWMPLPAPPAPASEKEP